MRVEPELLKTRVGMGVKGRQCGRGRSYTGPMRPIDIKEVTGVGRQKKKRDRKKTGMGEKQQKQVLFE